MIRASSHTLEFTNKEKRQTINEFVKEYREMVKKYVNILWEMQEYPKFLDNSICQQIRTSVKWDSNIRQCAAKQACAMVKSALNKHLQRLFKLKELQAEGKDTKYLQRKIAFNQPKKPNTDNINVELDRRFIDFEEKDGYFDLFVKIKWIGNKREIKIPIKHTKVSKKWEKLGKLKQSIRINENTINLYFEVEKPKKKTKGVTRGADQGETTCLSISDGQVTKKNKDGYDLSTIQDILTRRKKGSKGFRRTQEHRKNYINWSINQLNFDDINKLKLEKLKDLRKGKKKIARKRTHWAYSLIKTKLVLLSEIEGFELVENDNKFMSQRCSKCGWTHKSNRKGKTFKCTNANCNYFADSDLNAASNHEVELEKLPERVWNEHLNRTTGFFWNEVRYDEPIVRHMEK